jgi:hypothetical protein
MGRYWPGGIASNAEGLHIWVLPLNYLDEGIRIAY